MTLPKPSVPMTSAALVVGAMLALASDHAFAPDGPDATGTLSCQVEGLPDTPTAAAEERDPAEQVLVRHISRRYYVAAAATEKMVAAAFRTAGEVGLDPLLVLAVISIESRFNPIAESVVGAKGLMQIIPRFHRDKLRAVGGEEAIFDPESNIEVGTRILQEYVHRTGTLEAGLQFYNGSFLDGNTQYANKVLAERERLEGVVRRAPPTAAAVALRTGG